MESLRSPAKPQLHDRRPSFTVAVRRNSKSSAAVAAAIAAALDPTITASSGIPLAHSRSVATPLSPLASVPTPAPAVTPTTATRRHSSPLSRLSETVAATAAAATTRVPSMGSPAARHRGGSPLLWTVLLAACVALASSLRVLPPLFSGGFSHLRRQEDPPELAAAFATEPMAPAAALAAAAERRLTIFGDDDRRPVGDPTQYPYSAVGLLRWSESLSCTASLIGDRFIVTAAECVLDADGNVRPSSFAKPWFSPGFAARSDATARAFVTKVHRQSDYWKKWTQNTYAILELDAALGQRFGVLLLPTLADLDQSGGKADVQLAGYDDSAAAMQYAKCTCFFPASFGGPQYLLLHDCDASAAGSPGSPLLVRYTSLKTYIIGIHSNAVGSAAIAAVPETTTKVAAFKQESANRGVLGPFIQKQLEALEAEAAATAAPSPSPAPPASSAPPPAGAASASATAAPRGKLDDGALKPAPGSTLRVSEPRITPAAAYTCIGVLALAWASILFIAVRHVRSGDELSPSATLECGDAIE